MKLSDAIAAFINEMLDQQDMVELQRSRIVFPACRARSIM